MTTVCNTGSGPDWLATSGAGYRLVADLGTSGLWAVDAQSQSGHPGASNYSDQLDAWITGNYHFLPMDREDVSRLATEQLVLRPLGSSAS
jgi:acyl-homoserine lactone acylase PvdQ